MHTVPDLKYGFDALEPHIDARTMEIHHDKHHAAYVANLNKALEGHASLEAMDVDVLLRDLNALPESIRGAVRNHGGGHANHSLFWKCIGPDGGGEPGAGQIGNALKFKYGNFATFQERFAAAAMGVFGSGWVFLVLREEKPYMDIVTRPNQDSPLMDGEIPILGLDVWEHAYYLNYQNRRADYVEAFWNVVEWHAVDMRFADWILGRAVDWFQERE